MLSSNWLTQNEFLLDLAKKLYDCVPLWPQDFTRIAELNAKYADLPGDFADLSLIVISERLDIAAIATLDSDFDIYRRYRKQPFERIFVLQYESQIQQVKILQEDLSNESDRPKFPLLSIKWRSQF